MTRHSPLRMMPPGYGHALRGIVFGLLVIGGAAFWQAQFGTLLSIPITLAFGGFGLFSVVYSLWPRRFTVYPDRIRFPFSTVRDVRAIQVHQRPGHSIELVARTERGRARIFRVRTFEYVHIYDRRDALEDAASIAEVMGVPVEQPDAGAGARWAATTLDDRTRRAHENAQRFGYLFSITADVPADAAITHDSIRWAHFSMDRAGVVPMGNTKPIPFDQIRGVVFDIERSNSTGDTHTVVVSVVTPHQCLMVYHRHIHEGKADAVAAVAHGRWVQSVLENVLPRPETTLQDIEQARAARAVPER